MITKKQVKHIAQLARLGITKQEEGKFQKDLSSVLEFINKLDKVKTDKIEPINQIVGLSNILREDEGKEPNKIEQDKLLKLAPKTKDRYVKVKAVL